MWILSQSKIKIINTDNVITIYEDQSYQIKAQVVGFDESILLASYTNREDCDEILAAILLTVASEKVTYLTLPISDEVKEWEEEISKANF